MRYVFDGGTLDTDAVQLVVRGVPTPVEPQVFDVLVALLERRDRVVGKNELLDAVWQHRFVTDSALSSRIKTARHAIGDDGRAQRLIRTVHGRGYQFVGDVRVDDGDAAEPHGRAAPIPTVPTPTIGREDDVDRVEQLLTSASIVTLVGPGGVGKTRLAIEVARRASGDVCMVDLTKVRDDDLVPGLVVRELGIHAPPDTPASKVLAEALRDRELLLVLDNFEHVLDAAALAVDLVGCSDRVRVLVTSRARLRVKGEHVYDVAPLSVDDDAVALFAQTARATDPSFDLDANLADVVAMCRAVDGIPLAIELAAGHVRTLSPALLRTRLGARLASPAAATRDAPERQQTITATVDWSLQLLGEDERLLFARLGIFSGPFPFAAVEKGCAFGDMGDTVDALTRLVDHSLIRRVGGASREPRFALLELLRERARTLLDERGERDAVALEHAEFLAVYVEDVERRRWTEASDHWMELISEMLVEIRAAFAWAVEHGDRPLAARIAANLGAYWHREGHHAEGRSWIAYALADVRDVDARTVALLDLTAGFLEWPRDLDAARRHWAGAVAAFRALGDDRYVAYALALQSGTYIGDADRYDHAIRLSDEAVALALRVGDRPLIAQALCVKGELARVAGDDGMAREVYEQGLDAAAECGDAAMRSMLLANLSYLADHRGDHDEARRLACDALRICWSLGYRTVAAWLLSELAGPELGFGRADRGAILVGAADEAMRVVGVPRHPGDRSEHERVVAGLRRALGDDELERLRAQGARLPLDAAVALALSEPEDGERAQPAMVSASTNASARIHST
jgi:predicted ATPase/DNA-binding winged helix-turn-helix (wHTH) protein